MGESGSFYFNFFRQRPGEESFAWSPTLSKNFHELSKLGQLFTKFEKFEVNGEFKAGEEKLLSGWYKHYWKKFRPFSTGILKRDAGNILHIYDVKGKKGFNLNSHSCNKAENGDLILFKFNCRGTGGMTVDVGLFDEKREFFCTQPSGAGIKLSKEWTEESIKVRLLKDTSPKIGYVDLRLIGDEGTEVYISDFEVVRICK
jgi:hypothetical protein